MPAATKFLRGGNDHSNYTPPVASQRYRPIYIGVLIIIGAWVLAWTGHRAATNSKITAEKIVARVRTVDLGKMSVESRARWFADLAAKLNSLPPDERRRARLEHGWENLIAQMTEAEQNAFIESTMPAGFQQMLAGFDLLPADKKRRVIRDAFNRLREARQTLGIQDPNAPQVSQGTNRPPTLSEELQRQSATMGLKSFYDQSSPHTKAELAALLDEMQRVMESGALFRGR